jgi:hypothetical protein
MANPNNKNFFLPTTRQHVTMGYEWGQAAGTDFWLVNNSGFDIYAAAATTSGEQLAENGWTATSIVNTAGSGSDFRGGVFTKTTAPGPKTGSHGGTFADAGTPNHGLTNASADLLLSPAHMRMAAQLAGKAALPNYLIADFWAAFTVASATEVRTSIGFYTAATTDSTVEAGQLAALQSDGTNFLLAGAAATMTKGALIDTNWHNWRIVLQFNGAIGANCFWYIDGALQSTTAGVAAQDVFPCKWGFGTLTTNRTGVGLTHVYYDW